MVSLLLLTQWRRQEFSKIIPPGTEAEKLDLPSISLSPSNQNRHLGFGKLGDIFQLGTQILVLAG